MHYLKLSSVKNILLKFHIDICKIDEVIEFQRKQENKSDRVPLSDAVCMKSRSSRFGFQLLIFIVYYCSKQKNFFPSTYISLQKRISIRLRACKKKIMGLGDKGKLTGKLIDELTVYYGLAIRRNCDSVKKMKEAIWATFDHKCSTDEEPRHNNCPQGPESWFSWQQAKAAGTLQEYKHKTPLHDDVIKAIRPIYEDLSDDNLLERCVGGFIQNTNESLNNVIWRVAPKVLYSGASIVKIAANIATCTFNEGATAYLLIMQALNINVGQKCATYCENQDRAHINLADIRRGNTRRENCSKTKTIFFL